MTTELIKFILPSSKSMRGNAKSLLSGITQEIFARKPKSSGTMIEMNHPAFLYGHLSLYPAIVLEMLGQPYEDLKAPAEFSDLFKNGAVCHDDQDGTRYPKMAEIVSVFDRGYDALLERVQAVSSTVLAETTIGPETRVAKYPMKGLFLAHLMTSHLGFHLGQVSSWRRSMMLPPA